MTNESEYNNFVQAIGSYELNSLSNKLIENGRWSDGISLIAFNTTDGKISSVSVCASTNGLPQNDVKQISVDEFIDIYTNLTAHYIKQNPASEKEYEEIFTKMIAYLNQNKFVK